MSAFRQIAWVLCAALWSSLSSAQELAPRAYWPLPKGTNVVVVGYQRTTGDIVTDPSLPLSGVNSDINYAQVTYQHTLSLLGRSANMQVNIPYTWGNTEGFAEGELRNRQIAGLSDMRMLLSINLLGAPSMDLQGFQALRAEPKTIIGASLLIQAPTGAYDADKLINAGTNRWAVKPAIGVIWPFHKTWMLEMDFGVWIFGDNDEFLGVTRQQDPILSAEFHLIKRIRPGFWASFDANYYEGGQSTIGGVLRADLQRNSRMGFTGVFPFKRTHAIRASYSRGVTVASGGDFDMYALNYLYSWR